MEWAKKCTFCDKIESRLKRHTIDRVNLDLADEARRLTTRRRRERRPRVGGALNLARERRRR
jgi:hypothetical protein